MDFALGVTEEIISKPSSLVNGANSLTIPTLEYN